MAGVPPPLPLLPVPADVPAAAAPRRAWWQKAVPWAAVHNNIPGIQVGRKHLMITVLSLIAYAVMAWVVYQTLGLSPVRTEVTNEAGIKENWDCSTEDIVTRITSRTLDLRCENYRCGANVPTDDGLGNVSFRILFSESGMQISRFHVIVQSSTGQVVNDTDLVIATNTRGFLDRMIVSNGFSPQVFSSEVHNITVTIPAMTFSMSGRRLNVELLRGDPSKQSFNFTLNFHHISFDEFQSSTTPHTNAFLTPEEKSSNQAGIEENMRLSMDSITWNQNNDNTRVWFSEVDTLVTTRVTMSKKFYDRVGPCVFNDPVSNFARVSTSALVAAPMAGLSLCVLKQVANRF